MAILSLVEGELDASGLQNFWTDLYSNNGSFRKDELEDSTNISLFDIDILAKSKPDECFFGTGEDNIYPFNPETDTCPDGGHAKHNQAYVWSLAKANNKLWFGTAPNMLCFVIGASLEDTGAPLTPYADTEKVTCEFGSSRMNADLESRTGDWRPPSLYTHDLASGVTEKQEFDHDILKELMGFRSAGALNDVVLVAGPGITGVGGPASSQGIGMCAFNAVSGEFLDCHRFLEYDNIRKFLVIDGNLYTGVRVHPVNKDTPFGAVLKWTGDAIAPFQFEVVGYLDGEAVELVKHEGRIFASTWPDLSKANRTMEEGETFGYGGLWMSPTLGENGLTQLDTNSWTKVWSASEYEADELTARTYNGGALASFKGYLYWGTLHFVYSSAFIHASFYNHSQDWRFGLPNVPAFSTAISATHRTTCLFRGRNFGTESQETEVLYGLRRMPAFVDGSWKLLPNKMGEPRHGIAGFRNLYNVYTWTMAVHKDTLYVGTMDLSYAFAAVMIPFFARKFVNPFPDFQLLGATFGADLLAVDEDGRAQVVDAGGLGNYGSYGIRTMLSTDDALFLGMANPMNLLTLSNGDDRHGGWELIRLNDRLVCERKASNLVDLFQMRRCYTGRCPRRSDCREAALYDDASCCTFDLDNDGDVDVRDAVSLSLTWFRRFWNILN